MPGPPPMHSSELARDRDANRSDRPDLTKGVRQEVTIPRADKDWHPVATRIYKSLRTSGQSDFYQDSDWAYAYMVCDDISQYMSASKRSAMMASTIYSAMTSLLMTEADRRRARIELDDPQPADTPASVVAIEDYKSQLGVG